MSDKINPKYVPKSLSDKDKKKQIKSIKEETDRPKVDYKTKRSITDDKFISKNIISKTGIDEILSKGRGAYYSAGSRPNVSATQWARARLASVIMGGPARKVDKSIWEKYKK